MSNGRPWGQGRPEELNRVRGDDPGETETVAELHFLIKAENNQCDHNGVNALEFMERASRAGSKVPAGSDRLAAYSARPSSVPGVALPRHFDLQTLLFG